MSDIEIAQAATMKPINEIGASLGIDVENLEAYGKYKAKVNLKYLTSAKSRSLFIEYAEQCLHPKLITILTWKIYFNQYLIRLYLCT